MPGNISANLLAELQAPDSQATFLLEVQLPGGTKRWARGPVNSKSQGAYLDRITQWGTITNSAGDCSLELPQMGETTIRDLDKDFSTVVAKYGKAAVRNSRSIARLMSPRLAFADWYTAFDGYLADWTMPELLHYTLSFNPKDQPLKGSFPKTPLLQSDFPNVLDRTLYNQWVRLIYGIHDSRGSTDRGMVPCPYVDRFKFWFLVCHGWAKSIDRVYLDGVQKDSSFYTVLHPLVNGRTYTVIKWNSDPGTSAVTADVQGYEVAGDGSGQLLTGTNALKHLIVNFLYNDYQGGVWLSDGTAPLSTAHWTAARTFLTDLGWQRASRSYGGQRQTIGLDAINEFAKSKQLFPFFTDAGLLAISADDFRTTTLWQDGTGLIRMQPDMVGPKPLTTAYINSGLADRVAVSHLYSEEQGAYIQNLEVRDLGISEQSPFPLPMPWSHASLAA